VRRTLFISIVVVAAVGVVAMLLALTKSLPPHQREVRDYPPSVAGFVLMVVIAFAFRNHVPTLIATLLVALLSCALTILWSKNPSGEAAMLALVLVAIQLYSCAIPLIVRGIYALFR
jgi:hypothetical protein